MSGNILDFSDHLAQSQRGGFVSTGIELSAMAVGKKTITNALARSTAVGNPYFDFGLSTGVSYGLALK